MSIGTAIVGLVALTGCGGGGDGAGTAGRSTAVPTTVGAPTSTVTNGPASSTTTAPTPAATATSTPPGTNPSTTRSGGQAPRTGPVEGVTVDYPSGWGPAGQLQATAFANGATCGSAVIVDRAPPPNAGPGAQIDQSFVQFCWRGLEGRTLSAFMAATYGTAGGFEATTLAGRPAFVSRAGTSSTYFVDTSSRRYQIATAVAASPALEATRLAEVQRILTSLSFSN